MALNDLLRFLSNDGNVAIYDGTNTTYERRKSIN